MVFFTQRKIPGLHKGSTKLRASCKQREYMGFQVTVVLGASGRIGRLLRHCWSGEESRTRIRWQSRRPLPALKTPREALQEACLADPSQHTVLDILAEPQRLAELCRGADVVLCLAGSLPGRGGDLSDNSRLAIAAVQAAARAAQAPDAQAADGQAANGQAAGAPFSGTGFLGKRSSPARVVLASSAAVYGNQPGLLREEGPPQHPPMNTSLQATMPSTMPTTGPTTVPTCAPVSPYGLAKREMEHQALALGHQLGVPVTALRIGNIAGLDAILGGWRPGFCLDQFADGRSPRRSYIGPLTLARLLAALVAQKHLPPLLNLAQPGPLEMAALLRAARYPFCWQPAPEGAIAEVSLDLSRLRGILPDRDLQRLISEPADARQMLAEWRQIEPVFSKNVTGQMPAADLSDPLHMSEHKERDS